MDLTGSLFKPSNFVARSAYGLLFLLILFQLQLDARQILDEAAAQIGIEAAQIEAGGDKVEIIFNQEEEPDNVEDEEASVMNTSEEEDDEEGDSADSGHQNRLKIHIRGCKRVKYQHSLFLFYPFCIIKAIFHRLNLRFSQKSNSLRHILKQIVL